MPQLTCLGGHCCKGAMRSVPTMSVRGGIVTVPHVAAVGIYPNMVIFLVYS